MTANYGDALWQVLDAATAGTVVWLAIILLLAVLGEMGLPATCPVLEALLIFTGFQIAQESHAVASIPFLAVTCVGRLGGSTSTYWISSSLGSTAIDRFGKYLRITRERIDLTVQKMGTFALPTLVIARFTPGFTVLGSIACGVSRIRYKHFLAGVTVQVLAWQTTFLAVGAPGNRVSELFDPRVRPALVLVWIATAVIVGAAIGYFVLRRLSKGR